MKFWAILVFILIPFTADWAKYPELKTLSRRNPALNQLKSDIFAHLQISKTGRNVNKLKKLKFYHYRVKKNDNFYTIMSRTGLNPDTLANVNRLASTKDIHKGQRIKIPNYRGIFYKVGPKENAKRLASRFKVSTQALIKVNGKGNWHGRIIFIPGGKLSKTERRYFSGREFIHPLPAARVSSRYGMRKHPFTKRRTFHSGVDLAAKTGTYVKASGAGKVVFAGRKGAYGNLVILKHKLGYYTYYGHLSRINVRRGQKIKQGQAIGRVGQTGRATGPHLHFELRRLGKTQSPHKIIKHS